MLSDFDYKAFASAYFSKTYDKVILQIEPDPEQVGAPRPGLCMPCNHSKVFPCAQGHIHMVGA